MKLPAEFLCKMKSILESEYSQFLKSYEQPRVAGLRANRLKIQPEALQAILPYISDPVDWTSDGFYYDEQAERPAKHPYYYAGLYYVQEPSAMLPAELLHALPGERVLDLCAAPGGKSVQLAAQTGRDGILVVNDIHPQRAKVLLKNMERYGVVQAVVLNETPERIREVFGSFFDKILIDAPCSGEGMFRKEPEMANDWSEQEVAKYAKWQEEILNVVPKLLRPGGEIVYSTCTFSREEDEYQIGQFVANHRDFKLLEQHRLWPHLVKGEGHFAAKLKQSGTVNTSLASNSNRKGKSQASQSFLTLVEQFSTLIWGDASAWQLWLPNDGQVVERNGHIIWEHNDLPALRGLKILRSGWLLGTVEKGRFRPSQAFALGLPSAAIEACIQIYELSAQDEQKRYQTIRYLRGETIQDDTKVWQKGWYLVTVDGYPLGWAKGAGNILKNEYPPGWRWEDGK